MQIKIGIKKLYEMNQDEFYDFLLKDGVFQTEHLIDGKIMKHWKDAVITKFRCLNLDNIHSVECDYYFERISDNLKVEFEISLSLHIYGDYSFYLRKSNKTQNITNVENVKFHCIIYLLEKGFWLPLSINKP